MSKRLTANDFPKEVLTLFDRYVHGIIDRRAFLDGAAKFAVAGMSAMAILRSLSPRYAQAQQVASKSRDREKAATESERRYKDQVDLKVAGIETESAVRQLPHTDSEQSEQEHRSHDLPVSSRDQEEPSRIDLKA